jgi:hypothetical protein
MKSEVIQIDSSAYKLMSKQSSRLAQLLIHIKYAHIEVKEQTFCFANLWEVERQQEILKKKSVFLNTALKKACVWSFH